MLAWLLRRRARYRLGRTLGLWYHHEYAAPLLSTTARVSTLQPRRAELALGELAGLGLLNASHVTPAPLVSLLDLCRVHPQAYVEATSDPEVLGRIFSLEPTRVDVDALLRSQRRAVGGTVAATLFAVESPDRVSVNLGGGFHHAEPESGGGFCVYNDIAVAVARLRNRGFRDPIAIVDLDYHHGNGNMVAFANDPTVLTYSVHGAPWSHVEAVANIDATLPPDTGDEAYLAHLGKTLPSALEKHGTRLVFYLAGADVLASDPLGGFALTHQGVLDRDRFVIELAKHLSAPTVVTLGGGYRPDAWHVVVHLLRWLLTGHSRVRSVEGMHERFGRIARALDPFELQLETDSAGDDDWQLDEAEILGELTGRPKVHRILDYYSLHGVELALERYGLLERLRDRGFIDVRVSCDLAERDRQTIRVHGRKQDSEPVLLVELCVHRQTVSPPFPHDDPVGILTLEWLLLQDPTLSFSLERQPLPGQAHPGLGLVHETLELMFQVCKRLGLSGILLRPAHFHVAAMSTPRFHCMNPDDQGWLDALRARLSSIDLPAASTRLEGDGIPRTDGKVERWRSPDLLLPVDARWTAFFESEGYRAQANRARDHWLGLLRPI